MGLTHCNVRLCALFNHFIRWIHIFSILRIGYFAHTHANPDWKGKSIFIFVVAESKAGMFVMKMLANHIVFFCRINERIKAAISSNVNKQTHTHCIRQAHSRLQSKVSGMDRRRSWKKNGTRKRKLLLNSFRLLLKFAGIYVALPASPYYFHLFCFIPRCQTHRKKNSTHTERNASERMLIHSQSGGAKETEKRERKYFFSS